MVMTAETKALRSVVEIKADGVEGEFEAVFSTFNVIDKGDDIVRSSAVTEGQEVPILWSHNIFDMPVGIATISKTGDKAIVKGSFIDSSAGRDARATIMATKGVMELSWGFRVTDFKMETHEGRPVRIIEKTDTHEVSFVLRGEGEETGIRSVKGRSSSKFTDQIEETRASVVDLVKRAESLAELRAKDGRTISDEISEKLAELVELFGESAGGLTAAITEATSEDVSAELVEMRDRFTRAVNLED